MAAANKGIGWDVARILAEQGLTTVVASRNEELGREATEKLRKATGAALASCVELLLQYSVVLVGPEDIVPRAATLGGSDRFSLVLF